MPGASVSVRPGSSGKFSRTTARDENARTTMHLRRVSRFVLILKNAKVEEDEWTLDNALSNIRLGFQEVA